MKSKKEQSSKLISYWLRHDPADAGLVVDEGGWTDLSALLDALRPRGADLTPEELVELSGSFDKKRWEIDLAGGRIRATHGHSFPVVLEEKAAVPPFVLYHGTAVGAVAGIMKEGLMPMSRQRVHLSETVAAALTVGRRHGQALVAEVDAAALAAAGATFYHTGENVWLTAHVPLRYIAFRPWKPVHDALPSEAPGLDEAVRSIWMNESGSRLLQGAEKYYLVEAGKTTVYEQLQDWIESGLLPDQRDFYDYR